MNPHVFNGREGNGPLLQAGSKTLLSDRLAALRALTEEKKTPEGAFSKLVELLKRW